MPIMPREREAFPQLAGAAKIEATSACAATKWCFAHPRSMSPLEISPKRLNIAAWLMALMTYAVLVGVGFDPEVQKKWAEAFGERSFGAPVAIVGMIGQALLFLPLAFGAFHLMLLWSYLEGGWRKRRLAVG
jgi:hypothetical protein